MALADNTNGLQDILAAVNALPEAGGGEIEINLQHKTVTPSAEVQIATADEGYDGLSKVTVNAIPAAYQDVTSVTAVADDVVAGKKFVSASGAVIAGTLMNGDEVSY